VIKLIESPELALSGSLLHLSGQGSAINIFDHVSLHGHWSTSALFEIHRVDHKQPIT
jgi:hypothetical protein